MQFQTITAENIDTTLAAIGEAFRMRKAEFRAWLLKEIGVPVDGTKAAMLKQATDFAKRLAVTDTQTRF